MQKSWDGTDGNRGRTVAKMVMDNARWCRKLQIVNESKIVAQHSKEEVKKGNGSFVCNSEGEELSQRRLARRGLKRLFLWLVLNGNKKF